MPLQGETPMRLFAGAIACAIILSAGLADAEELIVSQKNRTFDPKLLKAKLGDTVLFLNDDRYAHNLYSETPGFEFNIRKQMPGESDSITLDKVGEIEVRCAIHPRMRLKIDVREAGASEDEEE